MRVIWCSLIFLASLNIYANAKKASEILKNVDHFVYAPTTKGIKDLFFKAEIEGLAESLTKTERYGKIEKVVFLIYWKQPSKFDVEIEGLPRGFKELKGQLRSSIASNLNYFFPASYYNSFKDFELVLSGNGKINTIKGKDSTGKSSIHHFDLSIDGDYRLNKYEAQTARGIQKVSNNWKQYSWSHKKWVLNSITREQIVNKQTQVLTSSIKWMKVAGFGVPELIERENSIMVDNKKQGEPYRSVVKFYDYKINNNVASDYFKTK